MDLLTANRNQENGQDMSQMNGPPGPMGGGGASSFGGPVPPPPPADPFGGAQGAPMGGIPPENPFEPTFNNQPVPQGGSFAPQFPQMQDFGPPPPVPPMSMGSKRSRSAGSSSSSSSSSRSGKRRGGGGYEMSAFSANTSDAYDPTVHHDRPTSPDKSQFIQSQGPAGYAVTSVSR